MKIIPASIRCFWKGAGEEGDQGRSDRSLRLHRSDYRDPARFEEPERCESLPDGGRYFQIQFRTPGFEEDAKKLHFTEKQASAILEMRLYKLIGLEILALQKEYKETLRKIKEYQKILGSREAMDEVIKEDLQLIKEEFAVERRTKIEDGREAVYDEAAESARPGVFVLDKFGYCKILEPSIYERNRETVTRRMCMYCRAIRRIRSDCLRIWVHSIR